LVLESAIQPSVASAQALAVIELLADAATSLTTDPRSILRACLCHSAVSANVPLRQMQRARLVLMYRSICRMPLIRLLAA
jgi:hypothetical protein